MLPLDTPIPTPKGWSSMGSLKVGDQVFGEDGKPTTVTYVSPTQVGKMYELTFNDGTTIVACADHQWNTLTHTDRQRAKRYRKGASADWRDHWDESSTKTTQSIYDLLSGFSAGLVPMVPPVSTSTLSVPLSPLPISVGKRIPLVVCASHYRCTVIEGKLVHLANLSGRDVRDSSRLPVLTKHLITYLERAHRGPSFRCRDRSVEGQHLPNTEGRLNCDVLMRDQRTHNFLLLGPQSYVNLIHCP